MHAAQRWLTAGTGHFRVPCNQAATCKGVQAIRRGPVKRAAAPPVVEVVAVAQLPARAALALKRVCCACTKDKRA